MPNCLIRRRSPIERILFHRISTPSSYQPIIIMSSSVVVMLYRWEDVVPNSVPFVSPHSHYVAI
jgi:hypothetical protein